MHQRGTKNYAICLVKAVQKVQSTNTHNNTRLIIIQIKYQIYEKVLITGKSASLSYQMPKQLDRTFTRHAVHVRGKRAAMLIACINRKY